MKPPYYKAHLALFLVNVLYGAGHIIAKGVMPEFLTPSVFIFLRVSGAVIFFWILALLYNNFKIQLKDIPLFILCGIFGVAVNQLFFFHGLNLSSSFNSGIIMSMNPIMVGILSYFLLKEKPTLIKIAGVLLGASGAILLTLKGAVGNGDSIIGDLFLIINAMSYALYLVLAKPLMSRYAPITVITWVFTFGLFFVCVFPSTIPDLVQTDFASIPSEIYLKIVYIIVGVTFFTYLLTIYGLQFLSPTVSSSYIYFQPLLVVLFAFAFSYLNWSADYTNTITFEKIAYMILIFLGVYLTSKSSTKKTV
ncbi:DMT family transporter [Crocinitomicaceae bacterium]|jgi:drug/metabolite transporter (DMT)-like permease|nr:DMT family transporter [Flavobacteriales bacterium]MDA8910287.1 DMT family transporter [Crocinitomicaceae bacterium]